MSKFDSIRPYHDDEIDDVIASIISDEECIRAIVALKVPGLPEIGIKILAPILRFLLRREAKKFHTVFDFQEKIGHYMDHMVATQMKSFQVSGLNELDGEQANLYVGNHRDIALDPAFVNYSLWKVGRNTVRIAIGDNLLTQEFSTKLMRINKSFIVNRSERSPKKLLANLKLLSQYIAASIKEDNHSIWIAQREGRAKDGVDKTDSAILKMFGIAGRKQDFSEYMRSLNIVPVSISYEYDPCDEMKATELHSVDQFGQYEKAEQEDIKSIATGITGFKGNVHVAYGKPYSGEFETPDEMAAWIDGQVVTMYVLHPSNYFAYFDLYGEYPKGGVYSSQHKPFSPSLLEVELKKERRFFDERMQAIPAMLRPYVLASYANPIKSKQSLGLMPG